MKRRELLEKTGKAATLGVLAGCLDSGEDCGHRFWVDKGDSFEYTQDSQDYSIEVEEITGPNTARLGMTVDNSEEFDVNVKTGRYHKVEGVEYGVQVDASTDRVRLDFMNQVCKN